MRILLVHPPMDGANPPARRTESLGLGYIAAVLRRDGHDVDILDAFLRRLGTKETIDEILSRDFDCLGVTAYDVHKLTLIRIAQEVRKARKTAIIFAGGYFPTFWAEKLVPACPELDFVVRGEGERVASEVFGRIARGEDWHDVPGVAYLKGDSAVQNPLPRLIDDLDSLPFPARDELKRHGSGMPALILGSRGCDYRCSFCSVPSFYSLSEARGRRHRGARNVVEEMASVVESTGIKEFMFADDNFIGSAVKNRERVQEFVEEMKSHKLDVTFTIECQVDEVDEHLLRQLMEVGLVRVFLGVESGVQTQLDRYNKPASPDQSRKAIRLIRDLGLNLHASFTMIDPYLTIDEFTRNIQFVRETGIAETSGGMPLSFMTKLGICGGMPLVARLKSDGLFRERGFERSFVFKDSTFRILYGLAQIVMSPSKFLGSLQSRLGAR